MRRAMIGSLLAATFFVGAIAPTGAFPWRQPAALDGIDTCPVTRTNDIDSNGVETEGLYGGDYANDVLWTNLWMWGEGVVSVLPAHQNAAGEAESLKWAWVPFLPGKLAIEGRRLDEDAPPLRFSQPDGYGQIGFKPVGLTFPTPGCWQVIGRLTDGDTEVGRLSFVVRVIYLDR